MQRFFQTIVATLLVSNLFLPQQSSAQAPQKMSYQAVIRNSSDQLVNNYAVGMRISILQGSATGTPVYVETQTPTTNANGLVTLEIGGGTPVTGTFSGIDWSSGTYFIKTETDPAGGSSYNITGTSQLLSVPYALYSKTAGNGFNHYIGESKDGGIIFYIYRGSDGQEHGLIVALTESSAIWQNTGVLVNANRSWDGAYNTNIMTDSPAKTYVTGLGSGWYLPSIDELSILWHNRFHVNKALSGVSGTLLSITTDYWSSTEGGATTAYTFDFQYGSMYTPATKTASILVRAVRSF